MVSQKNLSSTVQGAGTDNTPARNWERVRSKLMAIKGTFLKSLRQEYQNRPGRKGRKSLPFGLESGKFRQRGGNLLKKNGRIEEG